jgi:hypothetical protein
VIEIKDYHWKILSKGSSTYDVMVLGGGGVSDLGRAIEVLGNFKGKVVTQGGGVVLKNLIFTMTSYVDGP